MKSIITFVIVTVAVLVGSVALLWKFSGTGTSTEPTVIADVAGGAVHAKGEGQVEIVEFSDFQCPACQSVEKPLEQLLAKYEGKVKFVYRYFPLVTIHKNALRSAQAAEAAAMQNKFWEMHDLLFTKQSDWEKIDNPTDTFVGYAEELGLDKDKFKTDIDSSAVADAVNIDNVAANKYGLNGTPTFFLNGVETDFGKLDAKLGELTQ